MRKHLGLALVIVVQSAVLNGQHSARPEHYLAISDRILFDGSQDSTRFAFPPREVMDQLTGQMHSLAMDTIEAALSAQEPSGAKVQAALRELQGKSALSRHYRDCNVPFAELIYLKGARVMVVAVGLLRGGMGSPEIIPYVQFYSDSAGVWKLAAETGSGMSDRMLSVAKIESAFPESELWYAAWGRRPSDTGSRVKIEVYAFDGLNVRTLWTQEGAMGKVTLIEGRIQFEYEKHQGSFSPPRVITEVFKPGPKGLERESITEKQ